MKQGNSRFKKFKRWGGQTLHHFTLLGCILGLLLSPLPQNLGRAQTSPIMASLSGLAGTLGNIGNMFSQQRQQNLQRQIQARLRSNPSGLFTDQSHVFPGCKLMPSSFGRPINVCEGPRGGNPISRSEALKYYNFEVQSLFIIEGTKLMSEKGRRFGSDLGIQCIENEHTRLKLLIDAQIRNIQALRTRIENQASSQANITRAQQLFEAVEEQAVKIEGLDKNQRLQGPDGINPSNKPSKDWKRLDSEFARNSQCSTIFQTSQYEPEIGLRKLRDFARDQFNDPQFNNFQSKEGQQRQNFTQRMQFYRNQAASYSLQEVFNSLPTPRDSFEFNFSNAIQKEYEFQKSQVTKRENQVATDLQKIGGVQFPRVKNQNYFQEAQDILNGGVDSIQRRYIKDCAFGSGNSANGISAISIQEITERIFFRETGNTDQGFKGEIALILDSKSSMQEKIAQIQQVQARYNIPQLVTEVNRVIPGRGIVGKIAVSDLLQVLDQSCQAAFDRPVDPDQPGSLSPRQLAQNAIAGVGQIINDNQNFVENFINATEARVNDCAGVNKPTAPGDCRAERRFDTEAEDFCFGNATTCSANIRGCKEKAQEVLTTAVNQRAQKAQEFNTFIAGTLAQQQALLANELLGVLSATEDLVRSVKGENFNLDVLKNGIAIDPGQPSSTNSKLGVALLGADKFSNPQAFKAYLFQLPSKLDQLEAHLKASKATLKRAVDRHIKEDINPRIAVLTEQWKPLNRKCKRQVDKFSAQVRKANEQTAAASRKQQEEYLKKRQELDSFCQRKTFYDQAPGCGEPLEALYESSTNVSLHLTSTAKADVFEYRQICARYNNDSEGKTSADPLDLKEECKNASRKEGISGVALFNAHLRRLADRTKGFSVALGVDEQVVRDFFNNDKTDVLDIADAADSNTKRYLQAIEKLKQIKNVCQGHQRRLSRTRREAEAEELCTSESAVSGAAKVRKDRYQSTLNKSITLSTLINGLKRKIANFKTDVSDTHFTPTLNLKRAIGIDNLSGKYLDDDQARYPNDVKFPNGQEKNIAFWRSVLEKLESVQADGKELEKKRLKSCIAAAESDIDSGGDSSAFRSYVATLNSLPAIEKAVLRELQEAELRQVASTFVGENDPGNIDCEAQATDSYINDTFYQLNNALRGPAGSGFFNL